jgi:5-methyltetrahydropteroyltriglutamate--homocysteine methyltransferase
LRYRTYADSYLVEAQRHARVPIKQAVTSASALSLLYPQGGILGYSQAAFLDDLVGDVAQIDFTEGRLAGPEADRGRAPPARPSR